MHRTNLSIESEQYFNEIKKLLKDKNLLIVRYEELKKEHLNGKDLVIAYGGDGTFVRAGNLVKDSLILGINAEPQRSEGALTSINCNEIEALKEILNGNFKTIKRQRAKVLKNGIELNELALNEVYVGASLHINSSRYVLKFKGIEDEQRSSGVIITTGTGSAAWYKSAGGKEFSHEEEKLAFLVREPYFGKRIFIPKILQGDVLPKEKLIIEGKRDSGGIIAINYEVYDFNKGDIAEISLSENPLNVVVKK